MKKHFIWIACAAMLVFFSLACNSIPFLAPTATPTATSTSTPTSTPTKTPTRTKTPTPTGIPGITKPVTVQGIDLQFTSVSKTGHWNYSGNDYTPKKSSDTFLVVKANVLTPGTMLATLSKWGAKINNGNEWAFLQSTGATGSIDTVTWVFVVPISETSYTINLPDGVDVVLDSLA